ncbi:zinc finger protein chinmo isoform X2 [Phymastichus coffea]|uniref:zinc finger protein chinmo isoform X2 n=1 Tax=Phymastichus coffea TaxID=108790 RepID=UPI00273CA36D|nr:zinc finger protein chinmo isoform X2 [Phymastichus coffea]
MYAPVGTGPSNHRSTLLNSWWLQPPAGGAVGHGCDRQGNSILEGGSGTDRAGEAYGVGPRGGIMDSHQQQFCLKWNSFGSNLATAFSNLFKSESLTDVILFCEGVTFKAHKLILAACSKHFQELFEGMPPSPAGLIVILDGTSAQNMAALLEFMYRGEVHVSQESLSSFLKAAECLQVKGLSIEHEKLAVAQRHVAAEGTSGAAGAEAHQHNGGPGVGSSGGSDSASSCNGPLTGSSAASNNNGSDANDDNSTCLLGRGFKRRTPTPAPPSPAPTFSLPNVYSAAHFYDSPQKRLMRSPSDVDSLNRASVLRDGAAFRPASAPHPMQLETHMYQAFNHPETPTHPHTAPHTPTELEREHERSRSEERERISHENRDSGAEDLRIKQEPGSYGERERSNDNMAERVSAEAYSGNRGAYNSVNYNSNEHLQHNPAAAGIPNRVPVHPPTPDRSPAPPTPALWNSKINKAGTVTTPDGKKLKCPFCERLYGYETNLRAHIRQRHQGIRVPCPFCSRTFTRNNTVRRHIAREHKEELNQKALQEANRLVSDRVAGQQ